MSVWQRWQWLKNRSNAAWVMALALVSGMSLATNHNTSNPYSDPTVGLKNAICGIYTNYLSNKGVVFAVVLVIVAWAGYMIYMGKREATDVIVKAVIATAIIMGATTLATAILSGETCPT